MKVTILEHIKESFKKIKEDTANKISELASKTVEAIEELESQKADTSHTHTYAGSSSVGGAATSAVKLQTARTLTLSGDVTGSTSFDGSANKTITATLTNSGVKAGTYGPLELVKKIMERCG